MRIPNHLKASLKSGLAAAALQPFWRNLYRLSLYGMGFRNALPKYNGEERIARYVLARIEPKVIFDVGAHCGGLAYIFATAAPSAVIHCFEPSPDCFRKLEELFRDRFHAYAGSLVLNQCAVSDGAEQISFFVPRNEPLYGTTVATRPDQFSRFEAKWQESKVSAVSLDGYTDDRGLTVIDYLKVDVEGGEHAVLRGARRLIDRRMIRFIHMEMGEASLLSGLHLLRLTELLPGYEIFRMLPRGLMPLIDRAHIYDHSHEIFHYSNLLIVREDERHHIEAVIQQR